MPSKNLVLWNFFHWRLPTNKHIQNKGLHICSWLVHSVSLPIRQSVIWIDVAVDVWNDLKTRYSQGDLSRIFDLQSETSSLSQNDLSMTDYFTKLKIIWDELDNFQPNLIHVCQNKCSCSVASDISKRKCEDQAMQFL